MSYWAHKLSPFKVIQGRQVNGQQGEQQFMNMIHRLGLIYMYAKYHQHIWKGLSYWMHKLSTLSRIKGDNSKGQQGGATFLEWCTPSWPDL